MMWNEIRQNKITEQWVIIAPSRGERPQDFIRPSREREHLAPFDEECPFCPGNEHVLPSIIMELPKPDGSLWQTRVVPNKYPALVPEGDMKRCKQGVYLTMRGYGRHEVIVESSEHNQQMALMSLKEVAIIIETYHRRYREHMEEHMNMMVVIFRNHGAGAGTSLIHPHSQLIVTGLVPHHIRWREEVAQRHFNQWGRCVYCEILEFEMQDRRRVVFENNSFLAFVPFAAEVPFEIWIVPKKHKADFGNISDEEKPDLAAALQGILARLYKKMNDPDYNYIINTSARYRADDPELHWYLQVRPRLTTQAGFEVGSGMSINPTVPEDDADFLNEEII